MSQPMPTFEENCERLLENTKKYIDAKNPDGAAATLKECSSVLDDVESEPSRKEAESRLGKKVYDQKSDDLRRRHTALSHQVGKMPVDYKVTITGEKLIGDKGSYFSKKYQTVVTATRRGETFFYDIKGKKDGKEISDIANVADLSIPR